MTDTSIYQCTRIVKTFRENYRSKVMELDSKIQAEPGQFLMIWIPGLGEKPYSIMQADPLTLLVVEVGPFSRGMNQLQAGERIWMRGPLGKGFSIEGNRMLLVGGGYGAAPLYFLVKQVLAQQCGLEICLGAKVQADLVLMDQFSNLRIPIFAATEDGSFGDKGFVTGTVEERIKAHKPDCIYACGPNAMLEAMEKTASLHRIPCQLSREAQMRCGIGLCGSCEHEQSGRKTGWLTCMDGPVQKLQY
jgi:dihydroorotate dehydrogenase electron transfer subunit